MAKDFKKMAQKIINYVGGPGNITRVTHCATRLRLELKDFSLTEDEKIKDLEGVTSALRNGNQYQVIIGGDVADVYEATLSLLPKDLSKNEEAKDQEDQGVFNRIINTITAIFAPIIVPLTGAGMLKALMAILTTFNLVSPDSQSYYVMNFVSDSVFYFLPVLLGFSAGTVFKTNAFLAAAIGGVLLHPSFNALVEAGDPVSLFGMQVGLYSYASSVIPIVIIVFVQKYIEKLARKIIPNSISTVFVPLFVIFFTSIIALVAVGPIGFYLGDLLATGFQWLSTKASRLPPTIIGAFLPIMVMFGLHSAIAPIGIVQLAATGSEGIFGPGAMVSNVSMGAAMVGSALATKNSKDRQISYTNGITAFMGITEPALYGVALPKRYPLIAAIIGGGVGGLYAGLTHVERYATGVSGLPAVVLYIGENPNHFRNIIIASGISIVVAMTLSFIFGKSKEKGQEEANPSPVEDPVLVTLGATDIYSPSLGELLPISEAQDEAFSSKALGEGVVIKSESGEVHAPFDGEVAMIFPTNHAIGLKSESGAELLIHIGIDTVELGGKYFTGLVNQGQKVKRGDLLVKYDAKAIEEAGYNTDIMVVVTNTMDFEAVEAFTQTRDVNLDSLVLKTKTQEA